MGSVAQNALKLWSHLGTCFCVVAIRRAQVWHFGIPQGVTYSIYSIYSYTCVPDYPDFGCLSLPMGPWDILGGQDWFAIPQVTARAPGHFCEFGVVEKGMKGYKGDSYRQEHGYCKQANKQTSMATQMSSGWLSIALERCHMVFPQQNSKTVFYRSWGVLAAPVSYLVAQVFMKIWWNLMLRQRFSPSPPMSKLPTCS